MQTITIQINNDDALKTLRTLENKHFISIVENKVMDSPALPGAPLSLDEFKKWIKDSEQTPTVSLSEVKERWANKKKATPETYQIRFTQRAERDFDEVTGYIRL